MEKISYQIHAECLTNDILDALTMQFNDYIRLPYNQIIEIQKCIGTLTKEAFRFYLEQHEFKEKE